MTIAICGHSSYASEQHAVVAQLLDVIAAPLKPYSYYYFSCKTNGICAVGSIPELSRLRPGDRTSVVISPIGNDCYKIHSLDILSHDVLQNPRTFTVREIFQRHHLLSAAEGVIQSARTDETNPAWNWMTLRTTSGDLAVAAKAADFPIERLTPLVDAEVRLCGYAKSLNTWRAGLGSCFVLIKELNLTILSPAPVTLSKIPTWAGKDNPHRQRTEGSVIAHESNRLFMRNAEGIFCEIHTAAPTENIHPGDRIVAAGFTEPRMDGILMSEALIHATGQCAAVSEEAETVSFEQLYSEDSNRETYNHSYLHRIIRIRGTVLTFKANSKGDKTVLIGNGHHALEIKLSIAESDAHGQIQVGCEIEATGLCLADVDRDRASPANLHFRTFSVLPRTAGDIRVLSRPSWWTPARLLVVIGVLMIALAGILVWNRSLKVLSERRGRSLFKEQIAHATAELRTGERTRIAVELHDSLSQNLAGVALQISAAKMKQGPNPAAAATHLETAERMLRSSRTELRRCLWDLREEMLDEKVFADAIAKSVDPVSADAAIDIRFNVPRQRLTDTSAHAILRIIRELVSNAVTHGRATRIRIAGECHDNELSFSVTDNGSGFDTRDCPGVDSGHFGLDGIRERVRRLNGTLALDSRLGKGTRAVVRVPIIHPQQPADEHS